MPLQYTDDASQRHYFFNAATAQLSWERPAAGMLATFWAWVKQLQEDLVVSIPQ